jgi:hypothetical protein
MAEDLKLAALRREVVDERQHEHAEWRTRTLERIVETRIHLAHWREHVRQRYGEAWRNDTASKLGRPLESVRLLDIAETHRLEEARIESEYLYATGRLPGFSREVPIAQQGEIERLLAKLRRRLPDTPIAILRGVASFWMTADEDDPGKADVWGNASSYFGAVQATSGEVLANPAVWLDGDDFVNTFMSRIDDRNLWILSVGHANGLVADLGYRGLACSLDLRGPRWGRVFSDERSDWNYTESLEETVRLRARRRAEQV